MSGEGASGPDARRRVAVSGHLGELLQGRIGPGGPLALLTLPCPALRVQGLWRPGPFDLHQPGRPILSRGQVAALLRALALPVSGRFTLRAEMPLGGGAGSSTAALVAVARLAGHPAGAAEALARAALGVEGASDPLMFPDPAGLLWASRQGRMLQALPALPPFEVLGGFLGPAERTDPADTGFADIADLAGALPRALASAPALAEIARESARRSLALRGARRDADPTGALAAELGALGYAIGHTGPARALIFAPGRVPPEARSALHSAGFRQILRFRPGS